MSKPDLERFAKDVKKDTKLQEELKKAGTDEKAVIGIAKARGYDFSLEELKAYAEQKKGELSEEQLDKVAGGSTTVAVENVFVVGSVVLV